MPAWGLVEAQDSLFKRSRVPMLCVDEHGYVLDINDAAAEFLGFADPQQSGLNLMSTVELEDRSRLLSLLRRGGSSTGFESNISIRRYRATTSVRMLGAAPTEQTGGRFARQIALFDISHKRSMPRVPRNRASAVPQIMTVGA